MSPELLAVEERVEKGIRWLVEHDPTGAFHLWFSSGLTPSSPMPAQAPERREEWAAYFKQRRIFEALWSTMVAMEKREGIKA